MLALNYHSCVIYTISQEYTWNTNDGGHDEGTTRGQVLEGFQLVSRLSRPLVVDVSICISNVIYISLLLQFLISK